ncbi:MAG: UbiH/UbiF/VisC/COQ6 family ubiquinone biosynthesis hydroxylase [Paracoccaceae bacterium]
MKIDSDILIVGGGLNGPVLALALAQAGFGVTLVDALPAETRADTGFDGRAYALALGSQKLLAAVGVWPRVAAASQPITGIRTADGSSALPVTLGFDAAEIEDGAMGFMVEDRVLRPALLAAIAEAPGITHLAPAEVVAQVTGPGQVEVTLADGAQYRARLLIGADGRGSGTAARAGIRRDTHDYGQVAVVCAVTHELPHDGIAWQVFLPGGPLAMLPLKGNRSAMVWSTREAHARDLLALDDAGFAAVLSDAFGDRSGQLQTDSPRSSYPLSLSLAQSHVADRLALVGDAAHGVHPVAGQGLNLGLRDVAALAEVLVTARRRGDDIGSSVVLADYQRWRRFDNTLMALGMDSTVRLFSNDNPILRAGRVLGMGLVNALPPVRRAFIRQAAGIAGEVPRLMRGLPL